MRVLLVWALCASTALAQVVTEKYQVNAQFLDPAIKKNISKIGEGTVTYTTTPGNKFGVKVLGRVQSPRDGKIYDFDVDIDYAANGNAVSQVANRSKYAASVQEFRSRIENVIPFVYLVRYRKLGQDGAEETFRFRGAEFTLRTAVGEQNVEVGLYEEHSLIGKFFLPKDAKKEQAFDKFRLPTAGKISLTFVRL